MGHLISHFVVRYLADGPTEPRANGTMGGASQRRWRCSSMSDCFNQPAMLLVMMETLG